MLTVREIIKETTFDEVLKEIKKRNENKVFTVYNRLKSQPLSFHDNETKLFIAAIKRNEKTGEEIVLKDFDANDSNLTFDLYAQDCNGHIHDVGFEDDQDIELLSCCVSPETMEKFNCNEIIAHFLWRIGWR